LHFGQSQHENKPSAGFLAELESVKFGCMKKKRILVMGYMGSCPIAGVIWQHLHYLLGLQRLGHDVYYLEDSARYPYNPVSFDLSMDCTYAVNILRRLAEDFGFQGRWAYSARFLSPMQTFGLNLSRIRELYREADAVLNVCGAQELQEDILASNRLIYVESDPGVLQIKVDQGDVESCELLKRHRVLFSFGENIGSSSFPVPLHGFHWLPTRQPVVIDFWKTKIAPAAAAVFTTVANWSTSGRKDVTWRGENYFWSKSRTFLDFVDAPQAMSQPLELATDIKDAPTAELFRRKGWRLSSPYGLSTDRELYRRYIRASRGEFTVSKENVVRLSTGWFSDRSACYLAAGRPVITQETGFTRFYGGDRGLFAFSKLEEVQEAAEAIRFDYAVHSRAAQEIACEFFDAEKVLASLLDRAGV
jgi:hypothetical protein